MFEKQGNGKPPRRRLRAYLNCGCGKKTLTVPMEEGKEVYACIQLLIHVRLIGREREWGGRLSWWRAPPRVRRTHHTTPHRTCHAPVRAQGLPHVDQLCRVGCMTRAQEQAQEQRTAPRPHPLHVARERQEEANNECRAFVAKLNEAVGAEVVEDIRLKTSSARKRKRADLIVSYHRYGKTGSCGVPVHLLDAPVPAILEALWPKLVEMVG